MKVLTQKELPNSQVFFEIRVEGEEFQKGLDAAYRKNAPKLSVHGFRKGKAPKNLVLKTYGVGILFDDAIGETYPAAYEQAITEAGVEPVDFPEISVLEINEEGYTFTATLTQKPAVKLGAYRGLSAYKPPVDVTDEEVEQEIEALRYRNSRLVDVEPRPVQKDDIVIIDYVGKLDGVPFDGGTAAAQQLVIGSGQFIPGFEDQIIGHTPGETFDIDVTFPEDYPADELAGKAVVFTISLHAIKKNEMPELDDEFAKDVSDSYNTVDDLRAGMKTAVQEYKVSQAERVFEDGLLSQIVENMEVEVPQVMIDRQIDGMVEDFGQRLQQQGINLETYLAMTKTEMADFRKNFAEPAENNVKTSLALEAIVKDADIDITEEEFNAELDKIAEQVKIESSKLVDMIDKAALGREIAVSKALKLVKDSATVLDKEPEKKPAKKTAKKAAKKAEEGEAEQAEAAPKKTARKKKADAPEEAEKEAEKKPARKSTKKASAEE
ncbi:MAG TPA: trigger factor [Candidatus Galloscillospira excrementipullorum]|nr:trigger factor [Candidatus Galloscillospira excrementipullorum]